MPLHLPHRQAGYLIALVLSDTQDAWITFNWGCYQQTSRVGSGDCSQIIATNGMVVLEQ
jgi:hypothetical protein